MSPTRRGLFGRLAVQNLGRRKARTALLALAVAVGTGAVFATATLLHALDAGMSASLSRLGADLLVVPRDTLVNITSALLTAEPTEHTVDGRLAVEVARVPGARRVAPQAVYRTPSRVSSCSHDVDLIAFDPDRDFTVLPWLTEKLDRPMRTGDVLVGGRREYQPGEQLTFYGQPLTVYGRLGRTGVGTFDHAFFLTFDSAADLGRSSQGQFPFRVDQISALLVQLDTDATSEVVRFAVARLPGIKVIAGGTLLTSIRQGLTALFGGILVLTLLMLLGTALLVGVLFSAIIAERRRELGLLLALGARRRQVLRMVLAESALTTSLGGLAGVVLGAVLISAGRRSVVYHLESMHVPLVWPSLWAIALLAVACVALAALVGLVGAWVPAWRTSRQDLYALIRSEG